MPTVKNVMRGVASLLLGGCSDASTFSILCERCHFPKHKQKVPIALAVKCCLGIKSYVDLLLKQLLTRSVCFKFLHKLNILMYFCRYSICLQCIHNVDFSLIRLILDCRFVLVVFTVAVGSLNLEMIFN